MRGIIKGAFCLAAALGVALSFMALASIAQADQVACVRATLATLVGWLCTIRRECKAGCTASAERAALVCAARAYGNTGCRWNSW